MGEAWFWGVRVGFGGREGALASALIYLGAGKHPSPLDISESYSPDLYLKVGFYLIKKYCSSPKLSQFKIAHSCDSCQPLYIRAAM